MQVHKASALPRVPGVAAGSGHHLAQVILTKLSPDGAARPQLAQDEVAARVCAGRQPGNGHSWMEAMPQTPHQVAKQGAATVVKRAGQHQAR